MRAFSFKEWLFIALASFSSLHLLYSFFSLLISCWTDWETASAQPFMLLFLFYFCLTCLVFFAIHFFQDIKTWSFKQWLIFALASFIVFHVMIAFLSLAADFWTRWDTASEQKKKDEKYCQKVCNAPNAVTDYGANLDKCIAACRYVSSVGIMISSFFDSIRNIHPCGINVPCSSAFAVFIDSFSGMATLILIVLVSLVFLWAVIMGGCSSCPWPFRRQPVQYQQRRYRGPVGVQVDNVIEDEYEDRPFLLTAGSSTGNGTRMIRAGPGQSSSGWVLDSIFGSNQNKVHSL